MDNIENKTTDTDPLPNPQAEHRRTVKTYVMRSGRMTAAQERSYNELAPAWCIPFENKKLNFIDVFGNTNPIIVEIGFGMGDATVKIAQENPDINYLGIEVHKPGVGKFLREIKKRELKNLFVIEYYALDVLETMIETKPEDYYRSIIDYISGMTDVYALDEYQKICGLSLPIV